MVQGNNMRPNSIRWFDGLFLTAAILDLVLRIVRIREALNIFNKEMALTESAVHVAAFLAIIALWFAISHSASNISKWIWVTALIGTPVVSFALDVNPSVLFHLPQSFRAFVLEDIRPVLFICATIMLFRPDARAWFAAHRKNATVADVG
jgi:hypothetical protein